MFSIFKKEVKPNKQSEEIIEVNKDNEVEPGIEIYDGEEYIWVDGYKGTDKFMACRNFVYKLKKIYDLGREPIKCKSGFHFSLDLEDVYCYYSFDGCNRFFKVRGLVKKEDYDIELNDSEGKLSARKIEFIEELPLTEKHNELKEKQRQAKEDEVKSIVEDITLEELDAYINDKTTIDDLLFKRFKLIGLSNALSKILYNKIRYDERRTRMLGLYSYEEYCGRDYKKTLKVMNYVKALFDEDISNDMRIYLIIDEINKNGGLNEDKN